MRELTVDSKDIFYRNNAVHGYVEVVDAVSGEVLSVQKDYNENFLIGKMDDLLSVEMDGKTILVQKGITLSHVPKNSKYSRPVADLIAQAVTEGLGVTKACAKFGVSYATVMRWAEQFPEFGKVLDTARNYRAEKTHDDITDIAQKLIDDPSLNKTKVEALRGAADILKWSAEKSSPQKYGNAKDKAGNGAINIVIQTGISREPESTIVEVKETTNELQE